MAGAITKVCSERLAPFFFQPQSTRWMHRGVQTVFRRFQSTSTTGDYPVGSPKTLLPGDPGFEYFEASIQDHMAKKAANFKPIKLPQAHAEKPVSNSELYAEVRKLNERLEQILLLLKSSKP